MSPSRLTVPLENNVDIPQTMRTSPAKNNAPTEIVRQADGHSAQRFPDPSHRAAQPSQAQHPARTPTAPLVPELRRLERDLHDGVQTELVALIVKLALAQQDPRTPPDLADMLAGLEARAQAALDSVRDIVRGIYPPLLVEFGVTEALRAQAIRAAIHVSIIGTAPRSTEEAEEAVYFCCSEAIQNAAKHAGPSANVKLSFHHDHGMLLVRVADDGRGFDQAHTALGGGVQNIRERVEGLGGFFKLASRPGRGTVLTVSLPWPTRADHRP